MTLARKFFFNLLEKLQNGTLEIREGACVYRFGKSTDKYPKPIILEVLNPELYRRVLLGGNVALGESYVEGVWRASDLTQLLRLFLRNQSILSKVDHGFSMFRRFLNWLNHQMRRNTVYGSQKNIAAHYDLSNDFFQRFLDPTMMYSCSIFPYPNASLEEASRYKLDKICQKLALTSKDNIVEIGTGWGGFAIHAAENYGCKIVTTTISNQQYQLAKDRVREKKLDKNITIIQQDYRKLKGTYDKLVSIEMIEAVGHHYFDIFFKSCSHLLNPDGQLLIQAITIEDQSYEKAKCEVDFIKKYIFPGSCIPSITALTSSMTRVSNLRLYHVEDIGLHYAKTLACWRNNLFSARNELLALGFNDFLFRQWEYYFSYCEAGFAERYISDVQLHCLKPEALKAT